MGLFQRGQAGEWGFFPRFPHNKFLQFFFIVFFLRLRHLTFFWIINIQKIKYTINEAITASAIATATATATSYNGIDNQNSNHRHLKLLQTSSTGYLTTSPTAFTASSSSTET